MKNSYGIFLISVLLLAGCASVTKTPEPASTTPTTTTPVEQPAAAETFVIEPVQRASMSENRAVVSLLEQAQAESGAGKHEAAGASLERALRIEPRNPWLWNELAQVRLAEGQYAQAITLARKSNSFSGGKRRVQAENWQVIGKARVAQGDSTGADEAFKLSVDLAKQAKEEKH
ncbi:MAG TPA: tetratricopeptide repeat protein [Gallionellaceae bacterium]